VPYADKSAEDVATGIAHQIEYATQDFRLDRQLYQPCFVEVLVEAEDIIPRVARVVGEYGVAVYSGAGFDGLKAKRATAERAVKRNVPTVVLNVGDRDDHGENIYRAAAEDAVAWAGVLPIPEGRDVRDLLQTTGVGALLALLDEADQVTRTRAAFDVARDLDHFIALVRGEV
jgi:hypothetical protein